MTVGNELIWADGSVVPFEDATVHVLAQSMQRGTTVFDVMRVVELDEGPHAFGLRPHVARFLRSMELMGMDRAYSAGHLEAAIATIVLANPGSGTVKMVAAWSEIAPKFLPVSLEPSIWIAATAASETIEPAPSAVRLKTATAPKPDPWTLPPSLKVAASYTVGVRERLVARTEGFDDVVFRTSAGDLAEGTTQAMFVVKGGRILVPPLNAVLDGITRRAVLDLAYDMHISVEVRPITWAEVMDADELFMCSTNSPVLPVKQIDDTPFSPSGPTTTKLARSVESLLAGQHPLSTQWLLPLAPLVA